MSDNSVETPPFKEKFASFLESPTRQNLRDVLELEDVEDDDLEFKGELLPWDKLAKHILAMANKKGGAIVFGVEENKNDKNIKNKFFPCGLSKMDDISVIEKNLYNYIPNKLNFRPHPFYFNENEENNPNFKGKSFLVILVKFNPKYLPYIALKDGKDIQANIIYTRRNRASEPINNDELQEIISKRIDTEYSVTNERKLIEHLEELKELYNYITSKIIIQKHIPPSNPSFASTKANLGKLEIEIEMRKKIGEIKYEIFDNPNYPKESFDAFVNKLITIKKDIIIKFVKKS